MKQIQPVNGNVLVKRSEQTEEQSSGGIIIPDTAKEKLNEGEVINIAAGASEEIAIGDRVIYKSFSGTETKVDGEEYLILPVDDILAKYVEADQI